MSKATPCSPASNASSATCSIQVAQEGQGGTDACVDLSVAKSVIASRLNLTQEHFSRILHELSALELIRVEGRRLRIPDLERLARHQCELAASGR